MTPSVLLVDDERSVLNTIEAFFRRMGWITLRDDTGDECLELYDRERPDVVILDLQLPRKSGLELLSALRELDPDAAVIMLTGAQADIATAVEAMRKGAENFLTKPIRLSHLGAAAERASANCRLRRQTHQLQLRTDRTSGATSLAGFSSMQEVVEKIALVAVSDTTVLLEGETGTGKTRVAQLIHSRSPRAGGPLVDINCAGLTATFLDSELFGHEKGAFTDARSLKRGLFELADGGTLLLDEIGDLAAPLQPKLLTALETRRFRRLGGTRYLEVDTRLIAATNQDLKQAVKEGRFRVDLYYRLAVMPIRLPPLRERRPEEILQLACGILAELYRGRGAPPRVGAEAASLLTGYAWPGNIRELRNVLERIRILAGDAQTITPAHLPPEIVVLPTALHQDRGSEITLDELERRHIKRVLDRYNGNRTQAARVLGISRVGLYKKLRRYGLHSSSRD